MKRDIKGSLLRTFRLTNTADNSSRRLQGVQMGFSDNQHELKYPTLKEKHTISRGNNSKGNEQKEMIISYINNHKLLSTISSQY